MPEFTLMQWDAERPEATVHPCARAVLASRPLPGDFVQVLPDGAAQDIVFEVIAVLLNGMRDGSQTEDTLYVKRLCTAEEWLATIATRTTAKARSAVS